MSRGLHRLGLDRSVGRRPRAAGERASFERDLIAHLEGDGAVTSGVVSLLEDWFGAAAMAHRPELTAEGWASELLVTSDVPVGRRMAAATKAFLPRAPMRYTTWTPLSVATEWQNRVLGPDGIQAIYHRPDLPVVAGIYAPAKVLDLSHMRMLVSDGPFLLQWVGLFRDQPFTKMEEKGLEAIGPWLSRRLAVERILASGVDATLDALGQILDLVGRPAFLVSERDRIVLVNEAGRRMLDADGGLAADVIAAAKGNAWSRRIHSVTTSRSPGLARHRVVLLGDREHLTDARLASVGTDHSLTPAEARVLERVVAGDPNKDIAVKLGCAPRTVEVHISSLLSKCRVDSRSRLIAWFWTR